MKFKNTIQNKLLLFSIISISLFSISICLLYWKSNNIYTIADEIITKRTPTSIYTLELQKEIEKSNNLLLSHLFNINQESSLQNINKIWTEEINPLIEKIKLQDYNQNEDKVKLHINSLLITTTTLYLTQQEVISSTSVKKKLSHSEIEIIYKSKLVPLLTSVNRIVQDILSIEKSETNKNTTLVKKHSQQLTWFTFLFLLSGLLFFTGFPYWTLKELLSPIHKIGNFIQSISKGNIPSKLKPTKDEWSSIITASNKLSDNLENVKIFATEVGNGNFETNINVFNNEGELGSSLAEMRESLIKVAKEDKKRNWGTNGIAQIGEILRNNTINPQDLYDNIISFLVKYINANQGGMFLLNSENKDDIHLELVACYAFSRKKYIEKRIEIGEGLTGQAVLEKDIIYVTEIPNNYISITSGLGSANPRYILIIPLIVNDEIHGVIELASFLAIENHEIEFLKKLAESIASTISNVKINERTKNLLDSSQEMTEQLRAQEEEMRQNVEELQATQEEMYRKQIEMDGQMSAINGIYLFVEFDINGYITNANELFLKTMKYSLEEINGKNHSLLISPESAEAVSHDFFWQELRKGISKSGEFKRITKDGSDVWLIANYTPVFDKCGELIKVIQLASDISNNKKITLELNKKIEAIENAYAVVEYNTSGCIINTNSIFRSLTGYEENELTGRHYNTFIDAEFKNTDEYKSFLKELLSGIKKEGRFKQINKKGNEVWIQGCYTPIKDINGNLIKILGFFTSISNHSNSEKTVTEPNKELIQQEEDLKKNLEELRSIQEEMQRKSIELNNQLTAVNNTIPIAELDLNLALVETNTLFEKLFNYSLKEVTGKNFTTFCSEETATHITTIWKTLKSNKPQSGSFTFITKSDQKINIYTTFTPVCNSKGDVYKVIALFLYQLENSLSMKEEIQKVKESYEKRIKELESKLK